MFWKELPRAEMMVLRSVPITKYHDLVTEFNLSVFASLRDSVVAVASGDARPLPKGLEQEDFW